jgi:hypothetical protein
MIPCLEVILSERIVTSGLFVKFSTGIRHDNQQVLNVDRLFLNITKIEKPQVRVRSVQATYHTFPLAIVSQ